MTKGALGSVCVAVWLGCFTAAAVQLPPDVLVDKYLLQARMLNEEKDHKGALEAMDRILALQKEHDLTLPEAFPFQYAQMAFAAGSVQATIDSANRYLTAAGREGKYYREALELLLKAEQKLQEPAVDRVGSTPVKSDLEPQPQAIPPSSAQTQKTIALQPMVDCKKWNSKQFFRKATVEDVTACINAGADPNARDGGFWSGCAGCTPLLRAIRFNKNPEVVKALLKAGADTRTDRKWTPLHEAVEDTENPAVIEALLKAGADPNARSNYKRTPLHEAVTNTGDPAVIEALLKAGADPNARDQWKQTPLHRAATYNNSNMVKPLLKAGADLEARDKWRNTPLHWAAKNINPEAVKALIDAGADQMAWNEKGKTPLQVASKGTRARKVLRNAWASLPESQKMAHQALVRRRKGTSGPDYLGLALGVAGGAAVAAAGGGSNESIEAGAVMAETIMTGKAPAGAPSPESATGALGVAGGGPCQIPGYPKPPGGVKNLGLPWCPASVGMQVRAFALQAAGAQCAISLGSSSTPEQIESARREIRAACARLDAWGEGNCQCPPGLRQ